MVLIMHLCWWGRAAGCQLSLRCSPAWVDVRPRSRRRDPAVKSSTGRLKCPICGFACIRVGQMQILGGAICSHARIRVGHMHRRADYLSISTAMNKQAVATGHQCDATLGFRPT